MTDEEKAEEIAKGFSVIEINGVTFHSMQEMLVYMNNLRKENAELSNSVLEFSNSVIELTNSNTELKSKVTELEAQIEKMKNCANCKYCDCKTKKEIKICGKCTLDKVLWSQWELAE